MTDIFGTTTIVGIVMTATGLHFVFHPIGGVQASTDLRVYVSLVEGRTCANNLTWAFRVGGVREMTECVGMSLNPWTTYHHERQERCCKDTIQNK